MLTGERFEVVIHEHKVTVSFMCFDAAHDVPMHHKCKGVRVTKDWQAVACECVCHRG